MGGQDRNDATSSGNIDKTMPIKERKPREPTTTIISDSSDSEVAGEPTNELIEAVKRADENRDKWLRAVADLENYKKRVTTEKSAMHKYKHEDLLRELLPVIDNLERALSHAQAEASSDPLAQGVGLTVSMFKDLLSKFGVREIEAVGKPFDPHQHEAMGKIKDATKPPNTIIEEYEKGYRYQDRLLRPSKVIVSAQE